MRLTIVLLAAAATFAAPNYPEALFSGMKYRMITYLYTVTNSTDQKPGRDVVERREALRKELDRRIQELDAILK